MKHRADSGFRKFSAISKICLGGQYEAPKYPTFHTLDRYAPCLGDNATLN